MSIHSHHGDVSTARMVDAIRTVMDYWDEAGCDCCSPNPLEDALDELRGDGERIREFGIRLAFAGQCLVDDARAEGSPTP